MNLSPWNVAVASVFAVLLFIPNGIEAQSRVGECTPGQTQCQAGKLAQCECYDEWRQERGEMVVVCGWEQSDIDCGPRPSCDESRDGEQWRSENGIYMCRCSTDEDGNIRCRWRNY